MIAPSKNSVEPKPSVRSLWRDGSSEKIQKFSPLKETTPDLNPFPRKIGRGGASETQISLQRSLENYYSRDSREYRDSSGFTQNGDSTESGAAQKQRDDGNTTLPPPVDPVGDPLGLRNLASSGDPLGLRNLSSNFPEGSILNPHIATGSLEMPRRLPPAPIPPSVAGVSTGGWPLFASTTGTSAVATETITEMVGSFFSPGGILGVGGPASSTQIGCGTTVGHIED